MRLLFAVFSLTAVAVFALQGDRSPARYRFTEVDDRNVEPFRAGQTYKYRLDTQVSSGMASVSDQHATTRIQADALIYFQTDRQLTLKLQNVVVGTHNREIQEPEKVQPMGMFKENEIKREEARQLELPCTFDYVDGLVERVRFHPEDRAWSKNIKKSALNMLQLNLKQRRGQDSSLEQPSFWQQERETEKSVRKNDEDSEMFVMPEITLEGECQTTYTLTKIPTIQLPSYAREDIKMFNVTKSINFQQCSKIADTRFGPKMQKPCSNCSTPEQLEENKLDRTTVLRHVVIGTPEKYGIKKVELVSHYVFKTLNVENETPMRVIVAGRLSYIQNENGRDQERELRQPSTSGKEESLLYSTEWDHQEKLFYMYGDEEFPRNTPFENVQNKVEKIEKTMKELLSLWSDKVNGIETEATVAYSRIVGLLRMCSQDELKEIYSNIKSGRQLSDSERRRAEEIIVDALANAGTHNTIKVLVDKILKKEIQPAYAVRALIQLKDVPAPSEKQVETLTHLCQNEVCSRHEPCRQVCWLSTASVMGQLCNQDRTVQDSIEQKKNLCQQDVKKSFVKKVMTQFEQAQTRYEKILSLKALGNAGLEQSVQELEKIIRNVREEPTVRMQAIDSLRRLRAVMPQKIQRVLMPVAQNVRERPEIRMMAISQILATMPEKPVLDQFGLSLIREPSRQVKSYVYGAMKKLSESPVPMERQLAQHLKSLVKMAGITEEDEEALIRGSRYYRIPVYSWAKKEGFLVELESMVGSDNVLPKHLSAGLDSYINGLFQKNSLEISMTQEDLEQWVEKLMDIYMDYQYGESKKSLRGYRTSSQRDSWNAEAQSDFHSIVSGLGIQRRRDSGSNTPFGMLNVRYGDVDYALLPLEEEFMPQALKKIFVQGQRPSARDIENMADYIQGRPFNVQIALNLLENSVKIPTSAGLPIRMWHAIPVLASVEGHLKPQLRGSKIEVEAKLHLSKTITHLKRIEIWSPFVNTGVETSRTVSFNLPLTTKVQFNGNEKPFKLTVEVPENKFRALKIHTLPLTFVSEQEWYQRNPIVKRIENKNLIHRAQPIDKIYGKHTVGMPLKFSGEVHVPQEITYASIVNTAFTTENTLEVVFEPMGETPRQIVLTADGEFFQQGDKSSSQHRELKGFYSKSKFDEEMDAEYESDRDNERRFNRYLDDFEPKKMLKHNVEFELKTVGGRFEKMAQLKLEAQSDSQHRYVRAKMMVKRSPFEYFDESKPWTMETQVRAVLPDVHQSVQQYKKQQGEKQQKLVVQVESEWGCDKKQQITLNINGEQARNPEWRQKIEEVERLNSQDAPRLREQMIHKVAFLNKYDISAEYKHLTPETKNLFNYLNTILKVANFWNTRSELKNTQRDGQVTATIVIDPFTHQHVNITLKSPVEITRINSASLPITIKPFTLVKPSQSQKSVESFTDLVSSYADETRPECKVDSRKIRSFDDVVFKAPLTKCYSVLAKDCGSEKPRFAVLMKKINNDEKALKILTNGDKIEIEPKSGKLEVKINGKRVHDEEELQNYGIERAEDLVRIETRDVSIRFDGEQAQIKLSSFYKNKQCGLCGHYDDDTEDEFRTSNNEWTSDLKSYHKSYSLVDDECRGDLDETHRREEYKPLKESSSLFGSDEEEESQRRRRTQDNDEIQPFEKTETMEYGHKICFSIKPVKVCPEGSYPQKTKDAKIGFACLDRTNSEARRLLRQARRSDEPLKNIQEEHKISFVQTVTMPTTCVEY